MSYHQQGKVSPMTVAFQVREWTREIEEREAKGKGVSIRQARISLARKTGVTPSALEHVSRGRAKRLAFEYVARIRQYFIQELSREIANAEHRLEMARQCGLDPRDPEMVELESRAQIARGKLKS